MDNVSIHFLEHQKYNAIILYHIIFIEATHVGWICSSIKVDIVNTCQMRVTFARQHLRIVIKFVMNLITFSDMLNMLKKGYLCLPCYQHILTESVMTLKYSMIYPLLLRRHVWVFKCIIAIGLTVNITWRPVSIRADLRLAPSQW